MRLRSPGNETEKSWEWGWEVLGMRLRSPGNETEKSWEWGWKVLGMRLGLTLGLEVFYVYCLVSSVALAKTFDLCSQDEIYLSPSVRCSTSICSLFPRPPIGQLYVLRHASVHYCHHKPKLSSTTPSCCWSRRTKVIIYCSTVWN